MHACIGEGNGNPLQCSCLENARDGGAWWAALYGVAELDTTEATATAAAAAAKGKLIIYMLVSSLSASFFMTISVDLP